MLITQRHYAANQSIPAWLAGLGAVVGGTSTDLVFQNSDGTFSHLIGSGLSFHAFSNTWTGSVTHILRAMGSAPDSYGTIGVTTRIDFSVALTVSAMSVGLTGAFVGQLMTVPGNTNDGVGSWGNDTFMGSVQYDAFHGGVGLDVVDYGLAAGTVLVDLAGAYGNAGAAAGDALTSIEGIRGTASDDWLRGSAGNNLLDGAGGNDVIVATGGLDTLTGGTGRDRLDLTWLAGDLAVFGGSVGSTQFSGFESFVTGSGNDVIFGQTGDAEYITGNGHDVVKLGGTGAKTVVTGAGNDLIEVYGGSGFTLDMGADQDSVTFVSAGGTQAQIIMSDVGAGTFSGAVSGSLAGVEVINSANMRLSYYGHAGRDEVHASQGADTLFGANGDDSLDAGNGNDLIYGDSDWWVQGGSSDYGSDGVLAGGGDDTMMAGSGWDSYSGGTGIDTLSYAKLFDDYGYGTYSITLNANGTVTKAFHDYYGDVYTETDTIQTAAGDDIEVIIGTAEDDTFFNATTARTLEGGRGADLYLMTQANSGDTLRSFAYGADLIRVSAGATATAELAGNWVAAASSHNFGDLTFDVAGFDVNAAALGGTQGVTLRNTSTTDGATMTGTGFADRFESHCPWDILYGGAGDDTYVILGVSPIPLIYEEFGGGIDHLVTSINGVHLGSTIENITLVGTAVTVRGNPDANRIIGNDMDNVIYGHGGFDTMEGGLGSDTYHYSGSETLIEAPYRAPYYDIDLGLVTDPDRDLIISSVSLKMVDTGFEDLTLATGAVLGTGNLQGNRITGNAEANALRGLAGNDQIWGRVGHDSLFGGSENDRLFGDGGNDTLRGDAGNDTLQGSDGQDHLLGGTGVNRLSGGRGADQFVFGSAVEVTTVTDFTDGVDRLVFSVAWGLTEAYLMTNAVQVGADVVLTTTVAGTQITVQNCTIAALAGDILLA